MVRKATDMAIIRRRIRGFLFFCCIFLFVRSGFRALIGVRSRLLRRRSILTPSSPYYYGDFERGFDNRVYPVYTYDGNEFPQYAQEFQHYGDQYMQAQVYDRQVMVPQNNVQQMAVPVQSGYAAPQVRPVAPANIVPPVAPVVQQQPVKPVQTELVKKLEFVPKVQNEPVIAQSTSEPSSENPSSEKSRFDWDYDEEVQGRLKDFEFDHSIPNANFIFHNKLPKSGSTTMHDILRELSQKNLFYYKKMDSSNMNFDDDQSLTEYIKENMKKPFFYMQHHFFTNFTKYGIDQPTMINVIREPIDWFSSHYHFKLYGWSRKPGQRGDQNEMTLEECINTSAPTCVRNHWRYIEFFCGNGPECQTATNPREDEQYKSRMVERAKQRMLSDYFIIGVLEQFEDSLRVFEKLLPRYYRGALDVYQSKTIQTTRNQTKSLNKRTLPDDPTAKLRSGALKHEYDLYHFARQLFNQQMKDLQLERYQKEEL